MRLTYYRSTPYRDDMLQIIETEMAFGASEQDAVNTARRDEYRLYGSRRICYTDETWRWEQLPEHRPYFCPFETAAAREDLENMRVALRKILNTPTGMLVRVLPLPRGRGTGERLRRRDRQRLRRPHGLRRPRLRTGEPLRALRTDLRRRHRQRRQRPNRLRGLGLLLEAGVPLPSCG